MSVAPRTEDELRYRRSRFIDRFPRDRRYATSHHWLQEQQDGVWRIGYTKFAMRMLGEAVEADFEVEPGAELELGDVVGWLEGFKAISDLYTPIAGRFVRANPELDRAVASIYDRPYDLGWLFEVEGEPGAECRSAEGYAQFLDGTIDQMTGENP